MQTKGDYVTSVRGRVIAGSGTCVRFSANNIMCVCQDTRLFSVWSDNKNLDNAIVYTVDIATPSTTPWRIQLRQVFFNDWLPIDRFSQLVPY